MSTSQRDPLLCVKELSIVFDMPKGESKILNRLSLTMPRNSFLGLVGESGSGKTVFAYSLLGYTKRPGRIAGGEVIYEGKNVLAMPEEELTKVYRGKEVGLIAANARAHLNPLETVGKQLSTIFSVHSGAGKKESAARALEMLELVKINDPLRRFKSYPHELSGGMAQRIMIAMALINHSKLIVADDCTNGLDVTVAAQVMDLFLKVLEENKSSSIMITHDLGIIAQCCTDVAIMYQGQIIETCNVGEFFQNPQHPYSLSLLASLPGHDHKAPQATHGIQNAVNTYDIRPGCLFYDRCPKRTTLCATVEPQMTDVGSGHDVKCHVVT